jgi:DNA mismatch repair protein MutL
MIHILPDAVIDRIAAGEVVERPASVVKELIENSVDAGATRIEVIVEAGGKKLIKVVDNGDGMRSGDLQAAFVRHATSKLDRVEDLLHIASLGFRGEALASIGSVSHAKITSRARGQSEGTLVENNGGRLLPVVPAAAAPGTTIEVRNLFFHVPARLKFLKADSTELSHIVEAVTRVLLAHPSLGIRLIHNGRTVLHCEKNLNLLDRIATCFGRELTDALLPVNGRSREIRLEGFVGKPDAARKDRKRSYLFVNGRHVTDRVVHAAVRRAFRERLPGSLTPVYFLNLSIPHESVDVNVHPMKLEVRFRDGTSVFASVLGIVEDALASREDARSATPWAVREAPRFEGRVKKHGGGGGWPAGDAPLPSTGVGGGKLAFGIGDVDEASAAGHNRITLRAAERFLQVHGCYLLFEVEEGVALVDQHALHERVLFHRLQEEYESGGVLLQNLLVPFTVDVPRDMGHRTGEVVLKLAAIGIEAERAGTSSLKVNAIPLLIRKADPQEFALGIVNDVLTGGEGQDAYLDLLHSMACRAAIKAGDRLEEEELAELVGHLETVTHAGHCPHGRPTTILLTKAELEEMFKRRGF